MYRQTLQACLHVNWSGCHVCRTVPLRPSHDMSSDFCPGRRISNTAGKVISGTAIYWPGCWHSRTAEITYCQSSVQMTRQTVQLCRLCASWSRRSELSCKPFPGNKVVLLSFSNCGNPVSQNRNSSAAALSCAYARNTLRCCRSLKPGPVLELCAVRSWSNSLSE